MARTQLTVRCATCGNDQFEIPVDPKPDDTIECAMCGAVSKHRDIERASLTAGIRAIKELERRVKVRTRYL